jgi:hypothetical protein
MQTWCRCLAAFISAMGIGALSYAQSSVSIEKELFITDLAVVNHAAEAQNENGAFHIRTLLDAMAPTGKDAKDVVLSLLGSFRDSAKSCDRSLADRSGVERELAAGALSIIGDREQNRLAT